MKCDEYLSCSFYSKRLVTEAGWKQKSYIQLRQKDRISFPRNRKKDICRGFVSPDPRGCAMAGYDSSAHDWAEQFLDTHSKILSMGIDTFNEGSNIGCPFSVVQISPNSCGLHPAPASKWWSSVSEVGQANGLASNCTRIRRCGNSVWIILDDWRVQCSFLPMCACKYCRKDVSHESDPTAVSTSAGLTETRLDMS
jgi:hypothetical protein